MFFALNMVDYRLRVYFCRWTKQQVFCLWSIAGRYSAIGCRRRDLPEIEEFQDRCRVGIKFSGALFVFTSRKRDTIRLLYWDRTGFALWIKQLQSERFLWPKLLDGDVITLSVAQLEWLLDGLDITRMKPHETLHYAAVA